MRTKKTRTVTGPRRGGPQTVTYKKTRGEAVIDMDKARKKGLKKAVGSKTRTVSYTDLDQGATVKSGLTAKTKTNARGKSKTKIISTKKAERQMRRKNPRYGVKNRPKDYVPTIPGLSKGVKKA